MSSSTRCSSSSTVSAAGTGADKLAVSSKQQMKQTLNTVVISIVANSQLSRRLLSRKFMLLSTSGSLFIIKSDRAAQ